MPESSSHPVDRVIGGYLLFATIPYAFPHRPSAWPVLVVAHLALAWVLIRGPVRALRGGGGSMAVERDRRTGPAGRALGWVLDWYPLILLPLLYVELPLLNQAVWGGTYFDPVVQRWEVAVFGGQPAVTAAARWTSLVASEPLHLAYLSYYPILYVFPALVYTLQGRGAFLDTLFVMMLAFAVHYALYIVFPVVGPYFVFAPPGEPQSNGIAYQGVHLILGMGASAGTAFPSSHVAVSTVQTANAARYVPRAAPLLGLCVLGIMAGAVYARVHYAIDVIVGLGTGLLLIAVTPLARRWLS